jgi:hypothetical protein
VDYTLIIYLFVEVAHDALIATKVGYLNFWIARAIFFWVDGIYIDITQKNCRAQDEANDDSFTKKNFNISAGFLVFFIVTESIMSWDWIMSIDPHWFSTLFDGMFYQVFQVVSTVIALVTVF